MTWKERLYASLPPLLVLLGAAGVVITNEAWVAVIALAGSWLLPTPMPGTVNVSRETWDVVTGANVSRETSIVVNERSEPTDLPVPCTLMHGSAEDHVLGCEGWTFPR